MREVSSVPKTKAIIIVEDDVEIAELIKQTLNDEPDYQAVAVHDGTRALQLMRSLKSCVVLLDVMLPGKSGLELVRALLALDPATKIVLLTGYASIATAIEAIRLGAVHYLAKPAGIDEILAAFARAHAPSVTAAAGGFEPATLARAEWEHIQRVLGDCGGNISEAARRLGIHRRSLQRKLQKYPPAR